MGLEAATKALLDAGKADLFQHYSSLLTMLPGITYDEVQIAFVGYCYGDSTTGQVRS